MKLINVDDYQKMSALAAEDIIKIIKANPGTVLGLATGVSPLGLYDALVQDHLKNATDYDGVKTFNLDEYVGLDRQDSQSYYYFMHQHLFQHINIQQAHINIPKGTAQNLEEECKNYNDRLTTTPIDIQILGIGANGHIGFNEPGTPANSRVHIVRLHEKTRRANARFFNSIKEVPTHAITMGIQNIMEARKIILLAFGKEKAHAVYRMVKDDITEKVPASILRMHPNITVIVDREATSLLDSLESHEVSL